MEAFVEIPRAVAVTLTGGAGPASVALLVWSVVVVAWVVLAVAMVLRYAWRK